MRKIGKILGVSLSAAGLAACAGQGDFGRDKPNEFSLLEDLSDRVASFTRPADPAAGLPMTQEEQQLRNLAATVREATKFRQADLLERIFAVEPEDPGDKAYYLHLRKVHADSGVGLLNGFGNDVLRDIAMIDQFARLSVAVVESDGLRLDLVRLAMEQDKAAFSDAVDVILRVEDNGKTIDRMADLMTARLRGYRVALEQAAFDIPEQDLLATIAEAIDIMAVSVAGIESDAVRHRAVRGELFGRRSSDLPV